MINFNHQTDDPFSIKTNNILARFYLENVNRHNFVTKSMDVMIIPDDFPLEDVVTNFYLNIV